MPKIHRVKDLSLAQTAAPAPPYPDSERPGLHPNPHPWQIPCLPGFCPAQPCPEGQQVSCFWLAILPLTTDLSDAPHRVPAQSTSPALPPPGRELACMAFHLSKWVQQPPMQAREKRRLLPVKAKLAAAKGLSQPEVPVMGCEPKR